tara:strand:+ start:810 stop:1259 length:450 start_codon:yes stop_codon:yes gene_type:complete
MRRSKYNGVLGQDSTERRYGKGLTYDPKYRPASSQSVDNYGSVDSGDMGSFMGESWFLGEQFSGGVSPNMFYDIMRGLVDSEDNSVDPETGIKGIGYGNYGGIPVTLGGVDYMLTKGGLVPIGQPTPISGLRRNVDDDGIPDPKNPIGY